jgi:uncharacterized protein YodC (DUF2158 family)
MSNTTFKVGDVVQGKDGKGPRLVITKTHHEGMSSHPPLWVCTYWAQLHGEFRTVILPDAGLMPASEDR